MNRSFKQSQLIGLVHQGAGLQSSCSGGQAQRLSDNNISSGSIITPTHCVKQSANSLLLPQSCFYFIEIDNLTTLFLCLLTHVRHPQKSAFARDVSSESSVSSYLGFVIDKQTWDHFNQNHLSISAAENLHITNVELDSNSKSAPVKVLEIEKAESIKLLSDYLHLDSGMYIVALPSVYRWLHQHFEAIKQALRCFDIDLSILNNKSLMMQLGEGYKSYNCTQKIRQFSSFISSHEKIHAISNTLPLNFEKYQQLGVNLEQLYRNQIQLGLLTLILTTDSKNPEIRLLSIRCQRKNQLVNILKLFYNNSIEGIIQWQNLPFAQKLHAGSSLPYTNTHQSYKLSLKNYRTAVPFLEGDRSTHQQLLTFLIERLRVGNIHSLKMYWQSGLDKYLEQLIDCDIATINTITELCHTFFLLLDYKLAKYNIDFTRQDSKRMFFFKEYSIKKLPGNQQGRKMFNYDSRNNLYEWLYPGTIRLVRRYLQKVNGSSFWEVFEQFQCEFVKSLGSAQRRKDAKSQFLKQFIKLMQIQPNKEDQFFIEYISVVIKGNEKSAAMGIKFQDSFNSDQNRWQEALTFIRFKLTQSDLTSVKKSAYLKTIQVQKLVEPRCLGCAEFFVDGFNVSDSSIVETPMKGYSSVRDIKTYQAQIKQQICGMLNGRGGVILFGCKINLTQTITAGDQVTQLDKEKYEQQISSFMETFHPKLEVKEKVEFSFVPVVNNPYNSTSQKYQMKYLQGRYVARIRINSDQSRLYFWDNLGGKSYCAVQDCNQICPVNVGKIAKQIKRKLNKANVAGSKIMMLNPYSCFQRPCVPPEAGHRIQERENTPRLTGQTLEDEFSYMSMLIVRAKNIEKLREEFKRLKIKCIIKREFEQLDSTISTKNTAVMYHNISFTMLLDKIDKNSQAFTIDGRKLLIVSVTEYLRFKQTKGSSSVSISQTQMKESKEFLTSNFPDDKLKFFVYSRSECIKEWYAQTKTKLSTLLMYYKFNSSGTTAIFKNPKELDRLTAAQKEKAWREIPCQ